MYKRVLSIDPAPNNLGWSIIEKIDDDNFNLLKYGLINLNKPSPCKKCDKPSFYFNFSEIETIYCCKGHAQEFSCNDKIKQKTPEQISKSIIEKFDAVFNLDDFDFVIIENQLAFRNIKSKNIQSFIIMYFTTKNKLIQCRNPTLKFFGKKFNKVGGNKYRACKQFSVDAFISLFGKDELNEMKQVLYTKKIDDVTDSILLGIQYLNNGTTPQSIISLL